MSEAVFIRVLEVDPDGKPGQLRSEVRNLRKENPAKSDGTFATNSDGFCVVPGSPFAYWLSEPIRNAFEDFPTLEGTAAKIQHGVSTKDDFRYLRLWWEVNSRGIGNSLQDTRLGMSWIPFAKGGAYAPFYADLHLIIAWGNNAEEIEADLLQKYRYLGDNAEWVLHRANDYFRPGLTWTKRTTSELSVRRLPRGCIFSDKGSAVFDINTSDSNLTQLHGLLESQLARHLIAPMVAAATAAARSYEVGILQRLPIPSAQLPSALGSLSDAAYDEYRSRDLGNEASHVFALPSLVLSVGDGGKLTDATDRLNRKLADSRAHLADLEDRINGHVFEFYQIPRSDSERPTRTAGAENTARTAVVNSEDNEIDEDLNRCVANLLMWCVGVAYGRWDARFARDPSLLPDLQGPFERLPRVAPGGLVGPDGLSTKADRIASEAWLRVRPNVITLPEEGGFEGPESITAADYPIEVAWDSVLVDDPGHPKDIVAKVREVLAYVYGDRARAIEDEALKILQGSGRTPKTLRDWFRNQMATELGRNFFDFHVRRYSKSRRKAPIYWRLCTSPGRGQSNYGIWLYYHRLTDDTLWTVLNEYVGPKLAFEERELERLRRELDGATGTEHRRIEKEIEEKTDLLAEVQWFESELRKVAERGYAPDLDDGVIINLAPLHAVVPWKEPEKVWKKLEKGEYDWAKLAMRYWPERVREKCGQDRSLAIAHGVG